MKRDITFIMASSFTILTATNLRGADPVIHLQWDGGGTPVANFDYTIDTTVNGSPEFPDVILHTGRLDWRIWSTDTDNTGGIGDIGVISSPAAQNFGVAILSDSDGAGARDVKAINLEPTSSGNYSNISAPNEGWGSIISGELMDELIVQADTSGGGGEVTLHLGDATADMTIHKVKVLNASTFTGTLAINTLDGQINSGYFSGDMDIETATGGSLIRIFESISGSITVSEITSESGFVLYFPSGISETGSLSFGPIEDGDQPALMDIGAYVGQEKLLEGTLLFLDGINNAFMNVWTELTATGVIDLNDAGVSASGILNVPGGGDGSIINGGTISGGVILGQESDPRAEFSGDAIFAGATEGAEVYIVGDGALEVTGTFDGNLCGENISAAEPLPDNIQIAEFGPNATICGDPPVCELGTTGAIVDWKSVVTHGSSNTIGLVVPSDATYSEPRDGGVTKLRVSFSTPIAPSTVSAGNVIICGNDVEEEPVDLSGITVTTSVLSGDMVVDINFSPKLPNYARYRVLLTGVMDLGCHVIEENNERIFTSMFGDYTGDRRVNATDVGGVRYLEGTGPPINPNAANGTQQVRADVDNDDDDDEDDTDLVAGEVGKDARYIPNPSCP